MSEPVAPNPEIDHTESTSRDELPLEPSREGQHRTMSLVPEAIRRMPIQDGYGSKIDGIIGFVKLDGASVKTVVRQFSEDRNKQVFMLHARSQSAGLTLLSATHVFICEPLVNPVLQAQAVSRVPRIGQTKEDTVEIPCFDLFERNQSAALMTDYDDQDTAATAEITNSQDRNGETPWL
ncbi:MAG: hypothetical protein J3Q66DRAFT_404144 [Benniella sp.]|nr:MAG: hypothetical protein J3Q66DRAFT_404144 [Benniella sp.]